MTTNHASTSHSYRPKPPSPPPIPTKTHPSGAPATAALATAASAASAPPPPPTPPPLPVDEDTALQTSLVLERVAQVLADLAPSEAAALPRCSAPVHKRLLAAVIRVSRSMDSVHAVSRQHHRQQQKAKAQAHRRAVQQHCGIHAARHAAAEHVAAYRALQDQVADRYYGNKIKLPLLPAEPEPEPEPDAGAVPQVELLMDEGDVAPAVAAAAAAASAATVAPSTVSASDCAATPVPECEQEASRWLPSARTCTVCRSRYQMVHSFYHMMCPACGDENLAHRQRTGDLRGKVAVVTGARVKIGFETALKLLRAGATVVGTTRFPKDMALRYAALPDHANWAGRLHIFGLDLRFLPQVEAFAAQVLATFPAVHVLINNAAQTVRRPPAFYQHLLAVEALPLQALPPVAAGMVAADHAAALPAAAAGTATAALAAAAPMATGPLAATATALPHSTQLVVLPEDAQPADPAVFPPGELDAFGQQVDRRPEHTWTQTLQQTATAELAETALANYLAPTVLLSKLFGQLSASAPAVVVNVSAMEGKYSRFKSEHHPHTNAAKAALNMITRSCASAYAQQGVFLSSVDTGWVTDMLPVPVQEARPWFAPPLDEVDGAARVLQPVWAAFPADAATAPVYMYGAFLKDYKPTEW